MKKRLISLLLVFTMMLTMLPVTALAAAADASVDPANPFTDVKETDWFYDFVQYVRMNGIFSGTSKSTFDPDGTMTRGMFVTVLGRMAGVDTEAYKGQSAFSDVPAAMYYAPYVAWAAKHGITSGTGDGTFSPEALIDRQQMATFFVRYFEVFDVAYGTENGSTAAPADLALASEWAREPILKLWNRGLLAGDGTSFDPYGNATRAQAATLAARMDEAVETWYSEPGVPSGRVRIDPATGEAMDPGTPAVPGVPAVTPGGSSGGSSSGGGSSTRYYEVKFAPGSGQSVDIALPEADVYPSGTPISTLPTPGKAGVIFLGWYYDEAMTDGVETGDVVDRNMTLYAKAAAGEDVTSLETPNYVTRTEVPHGTYTFDVIGITGEANIRSAVRFINITGGNIDVEYSVNGTQVTAALEAGQTYQAELTDDAAQFRLTGENEAQPTSIRYLNIITAKDTVTNAELNKGLKQIPVEDTSGLSREVFDGLYQIDESGAAAQNESSGTFTYTGTTALQVGDTVAITSGDVDLDDVTSTEGDVAYVKITAKDDTVYSYEMAELEDVLFLPDVLPIQSSWDTDSIDGQITVSPDNIASAMGSVEADSLDAGDFLGFLGAGVVYSETAAAASYGKITGCTTDENGNYVITYTAAKESDVEGALDVYYTQNREIELTEEEKSQIEVEIKNDVQDSGYVEEAALYLASVMLESNNLEEVPDMEQVAHSMRTMRVTPALYGSGSVTRAGGGNTVKVSFDKTNMFVGVSANSQLEHLNGNGFDVSVRIPFIVTITGSGGNSLQIRVTAEFEEEVILKQNISTKRHKLGFLKYDYSLNASFEVGNYTGIGFQADIYTDDGSDEALTEKLEQIMEQMEAYQNGGPDFNNGTMDSLSEIYQDVMKSANDTWIDILNVKLFETNGNAFLHIFCWQIKGSFVVSANLNVSMGITFDYTMQKQYNFSVRVKAKTATNQVVDIIEPQYNFNFYVVGTIGIRAGLRLEMYVGLISLKLDKIGITAEVGAYTRLWGYFFYHLEWTQSSGKKTNSAGAMLIEIGIYLEIKFVAQVFNSSKLTWNPTLYSNEWPLWSAGEQQNVYAFDRTDDTEYALITTQTLALPGSTYAMKYMDLKNGKTGTVSKDDTGESSFIISFSNPAFSYVPATNTVTVTPSKGSLEEEADMVITWKKAALSFTSTPIQKVIRLSWSDPKGLRYISFDSMGGSAVAQISGGSGAAIVWPADPTKQGYDFAGWYTDRDCTTAYSGLTTEMPAFSEGTKGITLYAKWTPAVAGYTVEHYLEELNGTYKLADTELKTGIVGTQTSAVPYAVYTGFTGKAADQQAISADGSTVVKIFYDRETYIVTFAKNNGSGETITQAYRYGEAIAAPILAREGYLFAGWFEAVEDGGNVTEFGSASGNAAYEAQWTPYQDTPYRVEYYIERTYDEVKVLSGDNAVLHRTGTTDSTVTVDDCKLTGDPAAGLVFEKATVNGTEVTQTTIAANGSTVIRMYYTRTRHTLSFDARGGSLTGENTLVSKYGASVTLPKPTRSGYVFTGWYTDQDCTRLYKAAGSDMSVVITSTAAAQPLYAGWTANTNTQYTVNHLWQNADNDGYTFHEAVTQFGTTGQLTEAAAKTYTGFEAGVVAEEKTIAADGSTVVEVKYDRKTYTVTFDSKGGSAVDGIEGVRHGAVITAPAAPTKTGYSFEGWYLGETEWDFASDVVTGVTQLTAKWSEASGIAYTVAVYKMGVDGTYGAPANETKYGKTNAQVTASTTAPDGFTYDAGHEGEVISGTVAADGSLVLKVYFKRNQYTVTYDTGDGSAVAPVTGYLGAAVPAPTAPIRTGYTFSGWQNAQSTIPLGGATVTAQWTANTYSIVFDRNAPSGVAIGGEMNDQPFTYDVQQNLTPNAFLLPENSGYTFLGWAKSASAVTPDYNDGEPVRNLSAENGGEVTLYAVWLQGDAVEYTVNHYQMDIYGEYPAAPTVQKLTGVKGAYTAAKANELEGFTTPTVTQQVLGEEAIVFDLYYVRNQYTLTFKPNDGSSADTVYEDVYYGAPISAPAGELTKPGHTFGGWGEVPETMPAEDTVFSAVWTPIEYTITFKLNAADATTVDPITQGYGTPLTEPAAPTRPGYNFVGWYVYGDQTHQKIDFPETMPLDGLTLVAIWEGKVYTVVVHDGDEEIARVENCVCGELCEIPDFSAGTHKPGYAFTGFYQDAACTNKATYYYYSDEGVYRAFTGVGGEDGISHLYLGWEKDSYTFYLRTGRTTNDAYNTETQEFFHYKKVSDLPYDEAVEIGSVFTVEGHTLLGFSNVADGEVIFGAEKTTITLKELWESGNWDEDINFTTSLYCIWAPNSCTVTLDPNGGTLAADQAASFTCTYGQLIPALTAPTRAGWTFLGWRAEEAEENWSFEADKVTQNTALIAQWEKTEYTIAYVLNGEDAVNSDGNPSYYVLGDAFTLIDPTRPGYIFEGWYSTSTFDEGTQVTRITREETGDKTLYAKWKAE